MNSVAIALLYDEPDPSTYEAILLLDGERTHRFATGDPTLDYATAYAVARNLREPKPEVYHSSSIDHFKVDGGELQLDGWTPEQVAEVKRRARGFLDGLAEGT